MNSYFSHDSNARNSDKLLPVRMKYGAEGYGIYFMLLERLRDESEYMSVKDYNMIAFDLRVDAGKIKSIIEDFGLFVFTENGEYFYSEGFMKRMEIKDAKSKKRSEAGKKGAKKRWGSQDNESDKENNSNAIAKPSKNIASKVKESKVNKSKVKQSNKETPQPSFEEFNIYSFVQENFGRVLKPLETETLGYWIKDYDPELIKEAVKRTVLKNIYNIGYVEGILKNWEKNNIVNIGMVQEQDEKHNKRQQNYAKPTTRKETLPDWVDQDIKETPLSAEEEAEMQAMLDRITKKEGVS